MKKVSRKAKKKLRSDLKNFNADLKKITHKKKLSKSKKYLKKFAEDIKSLNNDLLINNEEKIPSYLYHIITTPFGAPFVIDQSLVEAAINFENQTPLNSDLSHLVSSLNRYENYYHDEVLSIFDSLLRKLKS